MTYLDVDENGLVDLETLEKAIRPDTILISIMFANNEIGTIEPVVKFGRIAHEHGVLFSTDAVQAYTQVPIDVEAMNIDMLSASAHMSRTKGIGFLYIRRGVKIVPCTRRRTGAQKESRHGKRSGNYRLCEGGRGCDKEYGGDYGQGAQGKRLSDRPHREGDSVRKIKRETGEKRLPNNVNFCFRFIEGESMLIMLDGKGICASSGSACTSGSLDPSHVLLAIGLPHEIAHGSLRLSISDETTTEEADFVVDELKKIIERLRSMSPLYEDFRKETRINYF